MITLRKLKFSNIFSYGDNNEIDFAANPITQLVGPNGYGKSSIALILELVLFNKNSKGIKTADIVNRYSGNKTYKMSLSFTKDQGDEYLISITCASTKTVKLSKNGVDISAHTATNTFKLIEETLGFTHKEFVQLIYQSSASSLEFLTATDSARKKFLIDLLDLGSYTEHFEIFKAGVREVSDNIKLLETKVGVVVSWLDKNVGKDLSIKQVDEVPEPLVAEKQKVVELEVSLAGIVKTNKLIIDNNKYKDLRDAIDVPEASTLDLPIDDPNPLVEAKGVLSNKISQASAFIRKVSGMHSKCPTCSTPIDISQSLELAKNSEQDKKEAEAELVKISEQLTKIQKLQKEKERKQGLLTAFESYNALIRDDLPTEILSKLEIDDRVVALGSLITQREIEIRQTLQKNGLATNHNAAVAVILGQMEEMKTDLATYRAELEVVNKKCGRLQILQKAFSTSGLPAYKIEGLIKDLEITVNQYLGDLSSGRFQLAFVIDGEKLNVVITDNGFDVSITSLSSGEQARVNTATLLAIRKMMQQLSDVKVNLLILDETLEHLDLEGKDKFIELLTNENHLNTFLISHSFSHPLLEKVTVVKENNISRLET